MNHPFMTDFADLIGWFLILMNHLGLKVIITLIRIIWNQEKSYSILIWKSTKREIIINYECGKRNWYSRGKSIIMDQRIISQMEHSMFSVSDKSFLVWSKLYSWNNLMWVTRYRPALTGTWSQNRPFWSVNFWIWNHTRNFKAPLAKIILKVHLKISKQRLNLSNSLYSYSWLVQLCTGRMHVYFWHSDSCNTAISWSLPKSRKRLNYYFDKFLNRRLFLIGSRAPTSDWRKVGTNLKANICPSIIIL